MSHYSKGGC